MQGTLDMQVGAYGGGALTCQLKLSDGSRWDFKGGFGDIGTPIGAGTTASLAATFDGLSHIEGSCAINLIVGGAVAGAVSVVFYDLHGTIGHAEGQIAAVGAGECIGGGRWSKA